MAKIFVIGIGPGSMEDMTPRAKKAIEASDVVIGYSTYVKLIEAYFPGKPFISSGMKKEAERCRLVLETAREGKTVALVSGGDSGIYGMAGIMLELSERENSGIPVEIIPGITAASAAAAILGAPVMHDFAVISLSDLLTPLESIYKRVECAAEGDYVICLYNPKSRGRSEYIGKARELVMKHRAAGTPVGIVRNACRENEEYDIATLSDLLEHEINMFTIIIIGNSKTYVKNGRMITPRGYDW